ncbi:MAG: hypothetical protein QMC98_02145 [Candidatus Thermoplasmatota archaeon]|nr:hypothetical protein [Candidatus Thermoplasmatota archaeon]
MANNYAALSKEMLKKCARNLSIKEGSVCSLQEGFGQRYITPYALALGASNTHIGMLNALPSMIEAVNLSVKF